MHINCFNNLVNVYKLTSQKSELASGVLNWHACIVALNNEHYLVVINDKSKYIILFKYNLEYSLKQLSSKITEYLADFVDGSYDEDIIDKFLIDIQNIKFSSFRDDKISNEFLRVCSLINDIVKENSNKSEQELNIIVNESLCNNNKVRLSRLFYADIVSEYRTVYPHCEVAVLDIDLYIELSGVYRSVIIPTSMPLNQLHYVIQALYNYKDNYIHQFSVYQSEVIDFIEYNEEYEDHETEDQFLLLAVARKVNNNSHKLEHDITIKDIINMNEKDRPVIKYTYKVKEDWHHYITIDAIIDDYEYSFPECTDGASIAIPEDSGSIEQYISILKLIACSGSQERKEIFKMAEGMGYENFNKEAMNKRLCDCFKQH